jgi:hypothetical protein
MSQKFTSWVLKILEIKDIAISDLIKLAVSKTQKYLVSFWIFFPFIPIVLKYFNFKQLKMNQKSQRERSNINCIRSQVLFWFQVSH